MGNKESIDDRYKEMQAEITKKHLDKMRNIATEYSGNKFLQLLYGDIDIAIDELKNKNPEQTNDQVPLTNKELIYGLEQIKKDYENGENYKLVAGVIRSLVKGEIHIPADSTNPIKEYMEALTKATDEVLASYKKEMESFAEQYISQKEGQVKKNVAQLNSTKPKNYIMPNTKISNSLDIIFRNENVNVNVGGGNKEILTMVNINFEDENIAITKNFTAFDRAVLNACISLEDCKNRYITTDMIYRSMNGLTSKEKVSPQQKGAITKSVDKIIHSFCRIDFTEEAKARHYNVTTFKKEGYVLPANKVELEAGGKLVVGYEFLGKSPLYEYAQLSNQIITVPMELLNTKNAVRNTDEVIIIREYLLRRIETMRSTKGKSNKIKYDSIYAEIGLEINLLDAVQAKKKTKKIRDAIKKILDYWKELKYIKGYSEYKSGKSFAGIDIIY